MICPTTDYAEAVLRGDEPAGPYVRAAAQRHVDDLRDGSSRGIWFDQASAALSIEFIEGMTLSTGDWSGETFKLKPWQKFIVGSIYGWKKNDGRRRFRRIYLETAKGSGKTPLAAAMALASICADGENRAEAYIFARTAEQASVTFRECSAFAEIREELGLRVLGGTNPYSINHKESSSFLKRLSSDSEARGKSGLKPSFIICDEYHEHSSSDMLDWLTAGFKERQEPIMMITTNAGAERGSACGIAHEKAVAVVLGKQENDAQFVYITAMDDKDDPWDVESGEKCWAKTNPSLPDIPTYDYIRDQVDAARGSPSAMAVIDRLNFCVWTDAFSPWLDATKYKACEHDKLSCAEDRRQVPCYAGLDISLKTDLTSLALAWNFDDRVEAQVMTWTPEDSLDARASQDHMPYRSWIQDGWLEATPGSVIDFDQVAQWIKKATVMWPMLRGIAYDPALITVLEGALDKAGVATTRDPAGEGLRIVPHPQGFIAGMKAFSDGEGLWMNSSIDAFEESVLKGRLHVEKNPLLRSALRGVAVVVDASSNRRFSKTKSTMRIDPAVALTMAVGYADQDPTPATFSVEGAVFPNLQ